MHMQPSEIDKLVVVLREQVAKYTQKVRDGEPEYELFSTRQNINNLRLTIQILRTDQGLEG